MPENNPFSYIKKYTPDSYANRYAPESFDPNSYDRTDSSSSLIGPRQQKANMLQPYNNFRKPASNSSILGRETSYALQDQVDMARRLNQRLSNTEYEGRTPKAYFDSRGYLTVGIGHKVLPEDN